VEGIGEGFKKEGVTCAITPSKMEVKNEMSYHFTFPFSHEFSSNTIGKTLIFDFDFSDF